MKLLLEESDLVLEMIRLGVRKREPVVVECLSTVPVFVGEVQSTSMFLLDVFKLALECSLLLLKAVSLALEYILHGLNPERILIAAEAIGIGRAALRLASEYASERIVFGRPIGQNQGVAHPLARAWANLEAADLMVFKAATLYDAGQPCGIEANAAKYLAAEAAHDACQNAVLTLGGMGYAKEYHVERLLRESYIPRIAPVSPQMILNFIAEKALGLPRSY